ncbi:hypothetical protein [Falsibacillus albus]|uniref:VCBS repeat-containing protein n=1 Tax=Falsibacillus albus TaxID=2478915 RepID=A0A3L7JU59_9BACI|nr:hypothetical protein [Falsibacillus albus]RLQ94313.1 hypothetical protein D9X91_14755 [Falsibacillus albus]
MKIIISILSAVILFSLSACGISSGSSSVDTSQQNQSQTDAPKVSDSSPPSNHSNTNDSIEKTSPADTETPENIKNVKGFTALDNQSFAVNFKSWGNVNFVSGKITGGNHIPTVFYLTNANGNILYSFDDAPFPYNVDVQAVSFQDVNKDGLKDIITIVSDNENDGKRIAAVWLQNADKKFTCDPKLFQEMNESRNNKDIKTIADYLSKKF